MKVEVKIANRPKFKKSRAYAQGRFNIGESGAKNEVS